MCPASDRCSQTAIALLEHNADIGVSALCAMAFLGAGHTHQDGPYAEHLSKVFSFILAKQSSDGSFSHDDRFGTYNDAIAAIAIAEALLATGDPILRQPLKSAVAHLAKSQQKGGGWDVTAARSGRNDTTVTTWVLMALKSAEAAGVTVPISTKFRSLAHFDDATLPSGRVWYADKTRGSSIEPSRLLSLDERRFSPGLTATGLYARAALGLRLDDAVAIKQVDLLLAELPAIDELRRPDSNAWYNEYYWYYGTLAMVQVGGNPLKEWNAALRRTVMEIQERPITRTGAKRHVYGSWPAFGKGWGDWGRAGGRIYSTAINTLAMEAHYGHVPAYLASPGLLGTLDLNAYLESLNPKDHGKALALARRMDPDVGEPVLLELCESINRDARLHAAEELTKMRSPRGIPVLKEGMIDATPAETEWIEKTLAATVEVRGNQGLGKVVEVDTKAKMLLFETSGGHVYYGQPLGVLRDGRSLGRLRVNRRFTTQRMAAARIEASEGEPRPGDGVVTIDE